MGFSDPGDGQLNKRPNGLSGEDMRTFERISKAQLYEVLASLYRMQNGEGASDTEVMTFAKMELETLKLNGIV